MPCNAAPPSSNRTSFAIRLSGTCLPASTSWRGNGPAIRTLRQERLRSREGASPPERSRDSTTTPALRASPWPRTAESVGESMLVDVEAGLRLQPVAVAAEVKRPKSGLRLSMSRLRRRGSRRRTTSSRAFGAVAPAHDRAARADDPSGRSSNRRTSSTTGSRRSSWRSAYRRPGPTSGSVSEYRTPSGAR